MKKMKLEEEDSEIINAVGVMDYLCKELMPTEVYVEIKNVFPMIRTLTKSDAGGDDD